MTRTRIIWLGAAVLAGLIGITLGVLVIGDTDTVQTARSVGEAPVERALSPATARDLVLPPAQRRPAAPFRLATASFADGSVFDLTHERGNVVVLFFMAAWCTTCIPEARALNALYEEYGDRGLSVLAIDIDPRDTETQLARFRRLAGNGRYLWARDLAQNVIRTYGVRALDTTIVIDRTGKIAYIDAFPTGHERLQIVIEALL